MGNNTHVAHDAIDISYDNSKFFTRFEAYLLTEKRVAQNTFQAYKRDIEQLRLFLDSKKISLEKITLPDLKDFLRHLHSMKLAASSTVRKISSLKIFFTYLSDRYEIPNMAKKLQLPKMDKKLPHYLSEQEIQKLFEVVDRDSSYQGKRNQVMLYLLYATGMRITELTSLRVSDIHFDTCMIAVRGKGGKQRFIPIAKSIIEIIQNYMSGEYRSDVFATTDAGKNKNSKTDNGDNNNLDKSISVNTKKVLKNLNKKMHSTHDDFLFPVRYGGKIRAISRQAFWVLLNDLWKKTGSTVSISPHKLRHSFATHMLKNGADLRSLQLLLGHENLSTVQIYTHVETSYLRKVYNKKHPRS